MKVRFYVDVPPGYVTDTTIFNATTSPPAGVIGSGQCTRIAFDVDLPVREFDHFVANVGGIKGEKQP